MKTLKFSSELIPLILSGQKKSTWRLWDDKDLTKGDVVDFLNHTTRKTFAIAKIIKVIEKLLGELTKEDKQDHEMFESDEKMHKTFSNYYNRAVDEHTPVKLIWFELLEQLK